MGTGSGHMWSELDWHCSVQWSQAVGSKTACCHCSSDYQRYIMHGYLARTPCGHVEYYRGPLSVLLLAKCQERHALQMSLFPNAFQISIYCSTKTTLVNWIDGSDSLKEKKDLLTSKIYNLLTGSTLDSYVIGSPTSPSIVCVETGVNVALCN